MTKQRSTKRALLMSALSLLLCVSMLVGTTYAWFTDEVVSGMNTIAAGNLDVELYAGDTQVKENTELFKADLWEPGMVVYENLQVRNVGTLALKYQMTLNVFEENNLEGHKLSEVLKVAVLDEAIKDTATRAEILAAAQAATAKDKGLGTLNNLFVKGELEAGDSSDYQAVVIYWAPNANEIDNLYNANNGKITSDGQPLHITFGLNLQATQLPFEEDSFDEKYDEKAANLPYATVNDLGADTITATWGIGGSTTDLEAPFKLQFLPNESLDQAQASDYRYWHVDFVVKADRDVPADSVALAGFYDAWCSMNNDNWVALTAGEMIPAGTEIRLVANIADGFFVNYEEICRYGNDPEDLLPADLEGFLCTAIDLTGENAGTTLTVELRMYETKDAKDTANNTTNEETGYYEVAGVYTYTFPAPAKKVTSATELQNALNAGSGNLQLAAGEYKMPSTSADGVIEISGNKDVVLDMTMGAYMEAADVTIKGVTIKTSTGMVNGNGSDYAALYTPNVTYINCTFEGPMRVGRDGAKFINCTFNSLGNDYVWTYGNDVSFENCTFNTEGKAILIYNDGGNEVSEVSVKNCTFNATAGAKAGAIANQNCAAIEIQNYGNGVNLVTEGNTCDTDFSGEWRIKTYHAGRTQVIVNGTEYTTIALDGKTMTIDAEKNVTVNP